MRIHKYKLWDVQNENWYDDDDIYLHEDGQLYRIEELGHYDRYMNKENVTARYEIAMFTGLKDKNGVDIYEGDIIRLPELYETPENTQTNYINTGFILFEEGCWNFSDGGVVYSEYESYGGDFEVVGNKYANPDLLEANHE